MFRLNVLGLIITAVSFGIGYVIGLIAGQGEDKTVMTVAARGYALYFNPMEGRTEAAFLHNNGTWYYRTILSFGSGTINEEETMTLDQTFRFDANPEDGPPDKRLPFAAGNQ